MTNKWYQKLWVKITAGLAVIAVLGGVANTIVNGVNWWNTHKEIPSKILMLEKEIDSLKKGDSFLYDFVGSKSESYAVGYRMKRIVDENGKIRWVKQYKDWKGNVNNIFLDRENSDYYGRDYYFYFDHDTDEKIYCP